MKYIHYNGTTILTGDEIADAVAEYAAVLGANGRTDTVHVPTADAHGQLIRATLLIGPASQIVLEPAPEDELEPESPEFVEQLRRGARSAGSAQPVHAEGDDVLGADSEAPATTER
ncbi:hypothetical protein DEJ28_02425 [Curtobacterium sp. MCPF17_002]|uniref:hypothetical protein n=1 Tax=Curtobacterium sp. MCPF17_002 TaxID=2175645 RepID=UPI000DAA8EF0|nr:hypothetical protein [Curtobacterium sp. MCPF17_002]WIB77973.1 hypothetical protein DEJ28_02425 [Curtobacterium sp. MCPF17_002]